jgi:GNAT superfamily N-acetyltransferase
MQTRRATLAEEAARYRVTAEAWGKGPGVTLDRYVERELALRAHAYGATALSTWVLVADEDENEDAAPGEVLASLETLRSPLWVAGERRGFGYGIASVFTEARFRGRGYASRLLPAVIARIASEDAAAPAFMLFSDVGAPIYARAGFVALPGDDWRLPAVAGSFVGEPILREDAARHLAALAPPPGADGFVSASWHLELTPERLDWHLEREALHARFGGRALPRASGVALPGGHLFWTAHYGKNVLEILHFRGSPQRCAEALGVASAVAHEAGLAAVVAWESEGLPADALVARGAVRTPRDGSLVMVTRVAGADGSGAPIEPAPVSRALWC